MSGARAPSRAGAGSVPSAGSGLPGGRRRAGLALVALGLPLLTAALVQVRAALSLQPTLLVYLLAVVVIAVVGGTLPAVLAAVASFVLANWFLTPPYGTLAVASRDSVVELLVFLFVAVAVSVTVEVGARQRVVAVRTRLEADLLERFTGDPVAESSPEQVLDQLRATFGMSALRVVQEDHGMRTTAARVGEDPAGDAVVEVPAGPGLRLLGWGPQLFGEDRRLLASLAQAAGRAVEGRRLADEASRTRELEAVDRLRSALLAAVGHELRTPLAGAKVAVSSLRQQDITWTDEERDELLRTIEECTDRLTDLVSNLLDLSRVQAGALNVHLAPVALDDLLPLALAGHESGEVREEVSEDLPMVLADAGLLERVLANLVENALRFSPEGRPVEVVAEGDDGRVTVRVVDHGHGVPAERWDRMFVPFQRLDDRTAGGGLGLGLAIARGFTEAMDGTLEPGGTPGGGLTMTLTLPAASS